MIVLIDGDVLVYKIAFAAQYTIHWAHLSDNVSIGYKSIKEARDLGVEVSSEICVQPSYLIPLYIKNIINRIVTETKADSYKIYLTSSNPDHNPRTDIAVTLPYKGNRKSPKPYYYNMVRDLLSIEWEAEKVFGMEADDMLGILQTEDTIISSIDKDLRMIPGYHHNMNSGAIDQVTKEGNLNLDIKKIKTAKGDINQYKLTGGGFKWFCAQMLLGDVIDNIQGIKGYGDLKTATALNHLTNMKEMWDRVTSIYIEKENEDRLWENAQLLWIYPEKGMDVFNFLHNEDII